MHLLPDSSEMAEKIPVSEIAVKNCTSFGLYCAKARNIEVRL